MAKNHLPILYIGMILYLLGCGEPKRMPEVFELPWGYQGWVEVEYQNPECPPLEQRDGKRVVPISSDGTACTSSEYLVGVAKDDHLWVGRETREVPMNQVWPGGTRGDESPTVIFFVGSEEDYELTGGWVAELRRRDEK